ncbi:Golgi resident protein GCP60-like [Ctenocephalides felis]|uniref:Golgi resident protein GCP60-like n=1 Tax=Ctenocephalides felis TaxID=7515 RepID=UPI000E6E4326|nr:Golgi resident protein GCP60-like [Ctenocephalides felis]
MDLTQNLEIGINKLDIDDANDLENIGNKWDFPLKELYRLAVEFYKEKEGKALHLSYDDKLKLIAFTQQAKHGQFDATELPSLGVLDVIGRDRRLAWMQLGNLSKAQSMEGFIDLLDRLCPLFKPYIEAIKKAKVEKSKTELINVNQPIITVQKMKQQDDINKELQSRNIKDLLNEQSFYQFKAYAEQQFPNSPDEQAVLIRQLQDQHYNQYMQQLHYGYLVNQNIKKEDPSEIDKSKSNSTEVCETDKPDLSKDTAETVSEISNIDSQGIKVRHDSENYESDCESQGEYVIAIANMWTRQDMSAFKAAVSSGEGDGVIRIGHGETVTVRVPTHEGGSQLYWEFATENHDIGFGLYFEWSKSPTTQVTVHITESEDEDELEDDEELTLPEDLECGPQSTVAPLTGISKPPITEIVPVYRRDCHLEVYAGSHQYPGEGVYLLKFDNSYSMWRSKTLYYRVYYTR